MFKLYILINVTFSLRRHTTGLSRPRSYNGIFINMRLVD